MTPEIASVGTRATIRPLLQDVGVADTPPNETVLLPCEDPKFVPLIVTEVPTGPLAWEMLVIVGVGGFTVVKTSGLGVALAPATFHTWL
jgi:hypothetical protein